MKKIFILILVIILVVVGYSVLLSNKVPPPQEAVFCPQDVQMCPDGSFVARSGPQCAFATCPEVKPVEGNLEQGDKTTGSVKVGQTLLINGVKITLNKIVGDNRCPTDVTCIVAGAVTANVTLQSDTKKETKDMKSDAEPTIFDSFTVALTKASPSSISTETIAPEDYNLTFKVESK